MDYRQLEAYVAVISTGSMTGAARHLSLSQPSVSRLVQDLEAGLGFQLLHRNGPRISPTRKGLAFYVEAERLLAAFSRAEARAADIATEATLSFDVAAISALGTAVLPRALAKLNRDSLPKVTRLSIYSAEAVGQAVLGGQADLGFSNLPLDQPGLDILGFYAAPCVAAVPLDDPLAAEEVISLEQFSGRIVASMGNRHRFRRLVDEALGAHGVVPAGEIMSTSTVTALHIIETGLAIGIVEPLTAYGMPLSGVAIRPLAKEIPFYWGVVSALGHPLDSVLTDLVAAHEAVVEETVPGFRRLSPTETRSIIAGDAAAGDATG